MLKTIKVSDKGQISIPNVIRQNLGINKGDELILIEIEGKLIIEKPQNIIDKFEDIFQHNINSLKEVWDNSEDEIWNQYLK